VAGVVTGARADGREFDANDYFVDTLFRSETVKPDLTSALVHGDAGRIVANALRQGNLPSDLDWTPCV
jgi:hypothetical protein